MRQLFIRQMIFALAGGLILPFLLTFIFESLDVIIMEIISLPFRFSLLWNDLYFSLRDDFWGNIFPATNLSAPMNCPFCSSYLADIHNDLSIYLVFCLMSFFISKLFIKERQESIMRIT